MLAIIVYFTLWKKKLFSLHGESVPPKLYSFSLDTEQELKRHVGRKCNQMQHRVLWFDKREAGSWHSLLEEFPSLREGHSEKYPRGGRTLPGFQPFRKEEPLSFPAVSKFTRRGMEMAETESLWGRRGSITLADPHVRMTWKGQPALLPCSLSFRILGKLDVVGEDPHLKLWYNNSDCTDRWKQKPDF